MYFIYYIKKPLNEAFPILILTSGASSHFPQFVRYPA
jgi:hypothetical protein